MREQPRRSATLPVARGARVRPAAWSLGLALALLGTSGQGADVSTLAAVSADGSGIAGGATGAATVAASLAARTSWRADRVFVDKTERKLHLMEEGRVMRTYDISLGKEPVGDKEREGDLRTPEGDYVLDWRNPASDFFMSMHISYPNANDVREARRLGARPGSMIMIHGLPNDSEPSRTDYLYEDWTDGCIAVSNQAMIDIWLTVPDNTPITIIP